jgi:hypothetical protein
MAGPKFRPTSLSHWRGGMDVHHNGPVDPTANRHFPDAARNCGHKRIIATYEAILNAEESGRPLEQPQRAASSAWRCL